VIHERAGTVNALYTKWVGTDRPDMPAFMEGIPFSVQYGQIWTLKGTEH
jgi:hypothetical protein